jgi:hypothetical protein
VPRKPFGTAVDKRNGQRVAVLTAGQVERFEPPKELLPLAAEAWDAYWGDRPSALLTPAGVTVLRRWIDALDRYLRTTAEADLEPLVTGSTGQSVPNPLYKIAEAALGTVERCERQLGIGGLNAASLGLAAITERRSLADMNSRYDGSGSASSNGQPSPETVDEDPRSIRIIRGETAG